MAKEFDLVARLPKAPKAPTKGGQTAKVLRTMPGSSRKPKKVSPTDTTTRALTMMVNVCVGLEFARNYPISPKAPVDDWRQMIRKVRRELSRLNRRLG